MEEVLLPCKAIGYEFLAVSRGNGAPDTKLNVIANVANRAIHHGNVHPALKIAACRNGGVCGCQVRYHCVEVFAFLPVTPIDIVDHTRFGAVYFLIGKECRGKTAVMRTAIDPFGMPRFGLVDPAFWWVEQ